MRRHSRKRGKKKKKNKREQVNYSCKIKMDDQNSFVRKKKEELVVRRGSESYRNMFNKHSSQIRSILVPIGIKRDH